MRLFRRIPPAAAKARSNPQLRKSSQILAGLLLLIGVLDVWSTNAGLAAGAIEINNFMRWLQASFGEAWVVPKLMLQAVPAGMVLFWPHFAVLACVAPAVAFSAFVVCNNFLIAFSI